jgi:hypothetical protein
MYTGGIPIVPLIQDREKRKQSVTTHLKLSNKVSNKPTALLKAQL